MQVLEFPKISQMATEKLFILKLAQIVKRGGFDSPALTGIRRFSPS